MVAGGDRVTGGGGIVGELPSVVGHYAELTVCTSGSSQGDTYHSNWDSTKEDRTTGHFSGTSTSSQGASGTFVGEVTSTRFTLSFSRVPPRYTCKDTAHIEAGWRDIRHVHGLRRQCWQLHRDTRFELGAAAFDPALRVQFHSSRKSCVRRDGCELGTLDLPARGIPGRSSCLVWRTIDQARPAVARRKRVC
jgi:hypothetical protein